MFKKAFLLLAAFCLSFNLINAQTARLVNPILAGFYPDPSIIKVGKDYYLVNSTFAYFPGIPVFHSTDLKNWKQIGNVIDRPSQMNFMGDRVTRGLFAPAINYHKGTFYITCTQIDHKGNFVVTAKNPAGPWSDPVFLPSVRGIDPSLFFDTDKAYVIYNGDAPDYKALYSGHRTIRINEFDPVKLTASAENQILVNGGVDISKKPVWIEGPHIMKAGNWYYLYAAEGGTSVNHSEVVFRSKSAAGPFVPYENNPILTQRGLPADRKNPVTSAGHADFVEGPDGKTYAIFLAVRPYEDDFYNTGRETFIAPVTWKDEWPVINPDFKEIQYSYATSIKENKTPGLRPQSGNFHYSVALNKPLDYSFLFLRTFDPSWYTITKDGLTMKLKPETCAGTGNPAFIAKRQQHLNGNLSTEMSFTTNKTNEKAGLVIFQNEEHYYYICKSVNEQGRPVIQLYKSGKAGETELLTEQPLTNNAQGKLQLRIRANGATYAFDYATTAGKWMTLKDNVDGKFLSTHTAGGFVGCVFALYATSNGKETTSTAKFTRLDYIGNDSVYR
jgi:xylan 1,4-beta-xylosidase